MLDIPWSLTKIARRLFRDMHIKINELEPGTDADEGDWTLVIEPQDSWWNLHRRDFVAVYKQTMLGPLWFFVQPLLTTLMFTVIFSGVAKISTGGVPPMLFYLAGTTPWNYFASCLAKTSGTFIANAHLFGKVYFPRLVTPLSLAVSNLIQFGIQFLLFAGFLAWYLFRGAALRPDWWQILWLTPVLLLLLGLLGLGAGVLVSALTTKYRDLTFLVTFGVQLAMYATPIIYPLASVPARYRLLIELNPLSAIIESFRAVFLGGAIPWAQLGYSASITGMLLLFGIIVFNRVEKNFMDTI